MPSVHTTHVKDALRIEWPCFKDTRGHFQELYKQSIFLETWPNQSELVVRQVNVSGSHRNALRGMHTSPYAKFVSVSSGAIYDVVVDLRTDSPTFGKWISHILSHRNRRQIYVPPYCGHGFFCLEDGTEVLYIQTGEFDPKLEQDITPFDAELKIKWPTPIDTHDYLISTKDKNAPCLQTRRPDVPRPLKLDRNLVIGVSGQVGQALVRRLGASNTFGTFSTNSVSNAVNFCLKESASTPDLAFELIATTQPKVIYICGAKTWVDGCESDEAAALIVNAEAPSLLARIAHHQNIKVVYFSTDYVFDGRNGPYREDAITAPLNVYGKTKLQGEEYVLTSNPNALIIRTTIIYGPEALGKNFVCQLVNALKNGQRFTCSTDQISTPTYNGDLADMVVQLVEKECSGIYNCVGTETLSRYDFAIQVARHLRLNGTLIDRITTEEEIQQCKLNGRARATRGLKLGLSMDKTLAALPNFKPRCIKDSLQHWMDCQGVKSHSRSEVEGDAVQGSNLR